MVKGLQLASAVLHQVVLGLPLLVPLSSKCKIYLTFFLSVSSGQISAGLL